MKYTIPETYQVLVKYCMFLEISLENLESARKVICDNPGAEKVNLFKNNLHEDTLKEIKLLHKARDR